MTLKCPPNRQSEHIFKTIILQLLLVPLFALPALAKLPKDVREALKNKYLNKVCIIQALAVPALLPGRKRGMGSAEPKRHPRPSHHRDLPVQPGVEISTDPSLNRGDRRSPSDVAPRGSGQGRGYWVYKSARVEIRNGKLAAKKDKEALSKFFRGEVVLVKKIVYRKDHIAIQISDLGLHSPAYRSSNLMFFFEPTFLTAGSFNEIFETIDSWLKPVETGYVDGEDLLKAAYAGDLPQVSTLLEKGTDIQHQSRDGVTALYLASQNGHEGTVQALLAKGAEIDHQTNNGFTTLMIASEKGHAEIMQVLLAEGAEINLQAPNGATALLLASQNGHEGIVQALLAKGAEIDHQAKNGVTALFIAANKGHQGIVQALLAKGANVELRLNGGGSALKHAKTQHIKQLLRAAGATQ